MAEGKWRKVSGDFFRFETSGQVVEGVLSQKDQTEVRSTPVGKYTVETPDGIVTFLGGVSLDTMLKNIPEGAMVKVVFLGKETTGRGASVKTFDVYVAEEE